MFERFTKQLHCTPWAGRRRDGGHSTAGCPEAIIATRHGDRAGYSAGGQVHGYHLV